MPLPSTSKSKSARTWWGYHATPIKRETRMLRWCIWATVVGSFLLLGAFPFAKSPDGASPMLEAWSAPGHVADVHKAWNHDCEACHQPFQPIKSGRDTAASVGQIVANWFGQSTLTVANDRCQRCHAAPGHHSNQIAADTGNCADCHLDHKGLQQSLVDLDDAKCLRCHSDLKNHAAHPELVEERIAGIKEFAGFHPAFRHETDPVTEQPVDPTFKHKRGLNFSHAVHMLPGMGLLRHNPITGKTEEDGPFQYKEIDPQFQGMYLDSKESSDLDRAVQLDCRHCHQLDAMRLEQTPSPSERTSSLPSESIDAARAEGRYFLPIVYEKHCRGCHPLSFDPEDPTAQVAHGLQPEQVQAEVLKHFSSRLVFDQLKTKLGEGTAEVLQRKPDDLRLDSLKELLTPEEKAEIAKKALEQTENVNDELYALLTWAASPTAAQIGSAAVELFKGRKTCGECHNGSGRLTEGLAFPKTIDPVNIPTIWQTKARFDHLSHQAVACRQCHPKSFGGELEPTEPALTTLADERERARANAKHLDGVAGPLAVYQHPADLPTLESCKDCHSQRPWWTTGPVKGGVAQRCTECHTYHNAEHGLQGRGARSLLGEGISPESEFLQPSVGWDRPQTKN